MFSFLNLSIYTIIARAIVLLTSIPVHECAHAWAAYKMGDDTARYGKRMSLNPFEHIDPIGALMILLVGVGWAKPVQVNSHNFRDAKKGMVVTAIAGPASNILLSLASLILYKLVLILSFAVPAVSGILYGPIQVLSIMVSANITLAIFNLLPIPPLDGWRVVSVLLPRELYWQIAQYESTISWVLILLVFIGLFDRPIYFLSNVVLTLLDKLTFFMDILVNIVAR